MIRKIYREAELSTSLFSVLKKGRVEMAGKGQKGPLVVCKTVRNSFVSGLQQTFQWLVAVKIFNWEACWNTVSLTMHAELIDKIYVRLFNIENRVCKRYT